MEFLHFRRGSDSCSHEASPDSARFALPDAASRSFNIVTSCSMVTRRACEVFFSISFPAYGSGYQ